MAADTRDTFTASVAYQAFRFNDVTLRKWLNDPLNPLRIDATETSRKGWRRFTRADAVRLKLLAHLVNELYVEPAQAIYAVNSIFDVIAEKVPHFLSNMEADGHAYRHQACFVMFMKMHDLPAWFRVFGSLSDLVQYGENRAISGSIIFELWKETLSAINAITRVRDQQDDASASTGDDGFPE